MEDPKNAGKWPGCAQAASLLAIPVVGAVLTAPQVLGIAAIADGLLLAFGAVRTLLARRAA